MKLTDDLKKKLERAQSKEETELIFAETKKGVENAGVILDDAELDQVAGGALTGVNFQPEQTDA